MSTGKRVGIWYTLEKPLENWLTSHFPLSHLIEIVGSNYKYPPRKIQEKIYSTDDNLVAIKMDGNVNIFEQCLDGNISVNPIKHINIWFRYNSNDNVNLGLSKFQALFRKWVHRDTLKKMRHNYYKPGSIGFLAAKAEFASMISN